ncbi:hypothetical protein [Leadbetterella byssophila]|uniref:hypothetical protein n=1 Tax=Leadbetterella byssophila TaxID=316068 RepID=UPI00399F7CB6
MTKPTDQNQKIFQKYNETSVLMAVLNLMLFTLDNYKHKSIYQQKIKFAGNHLKNTLEQLYGSIFTGNMREGFNKVSDVSQTEEYANLIDFLIGQCAIYTHIKALPEDKAISFFSDLEDVHIKHGLLKRKGDFLRPDNDVDEIGEGVKNLKGGELEAT